MWLLASFLPVPAVDRQRVANLEPVPFFKNHRHPVLTVIYLITMSFLVSGRLGILSSHTLGDTAPKELQLLFFLSFEELLD